MPGIEAREPERTETSRGLSTSPKRAPTILPTSSSAAFTIGFNSSGSLRPRS
jgi:hypothetical protein